MSGDSLEALALAELDKRAVKHIEQRKTTGAAVRLIRGDAVPLEPVRWLWPGFLPAGMLTILGGAPGCGKPTSPDGN